MLFRRILRVIALVATLWVPTYSAQIAPLKIRPIDAISSPQLDSIVMISSDPDRLTIWSMKDQSVIGSIPLPSPPTAVTLDPDGTSAAVGHNGQITIVDLKSQSVRKILNVSCDVLSVVYGYNGWVYALPRRDQWSTIRSVHIERGTEESGPGYYSFYAGSSGRLMPGTNSMYVVQSGLSPDHMQKFDMSEGPVKYLYDWTYHGDYSACGALWPSPDSKRILTRCGNVFRASSSQSDDMRYNGKLTPAVSVGSAAFSLANDRILTTTSSSSYYGTNSQGESRIQVFGYQNLNYITSFPLPNFNVLGKAFPSFGRFVFVNQDQSRWFSIIQADLNSGLLEDYAVASGPVAGTVLHSANRSTSTVAPGQLVVAFADVGDMPTAQASGSPAPIVLNGISVILVAADGSIGFGRVTKVLPGQVEFVIPEDTPDGLVQVLVDKPETARRATLEMTVQRVSPGLFTAIGDGSGPPLGVGRRVPTSGDPVLSYLYRRSTDQSIVPNPLVIASQPCTTGTTTDQYFFDVTATGLRGASKVTAQLGEVIVPMAVQADPNYDGRDQLQIGPLPIGSLRSGQMVLKIVADGKPSNETAVQLQYQY